MIRTVHKPVVALMLVVLITSCEVINTDPQGAEVIRKDGKILIRDQTGKNWDITHAVENYGFNPGTFAHGLGPNAIRPIQNPEMLRPGDPGYPSSGYTGTVLGTKIAGDARAYPLNVLVRHEIANEKFADTHVAVAY